MPGIKDFSLHHLLRRVAALEAVEAAESGGSGSSWNVVSPTADHTAAANDFVLVSQGILVTPVTVVSGSRTLTGPPGSFSAPQVGRVVDDISYGNGHIPSGTTVASVESDTSLTMSAAARGSDSGDSVQIGLVVTLPAPVANTRVAVYFVGYGGGVTVTPSVGSLPPGTPSTFAEQTWVAVFVGDGSNWQLESFGASALPLLYLNSYPQLPPLPTSAIPGAPSIWSQTANGGQGGWVQDTTVKLLAGYHSSGDAADILANPPFQELAANWSDTAHSPVNSSNFFGYIDHLPASGHAGLQLTYEPPSPSWGAVDFHVRFKGRSTYGVIRLDGSASCVVTAKNPTIPNSLAGGSYNADSTLMDWAGAAVLGTDLAADATNHWIHSTAGGLVYIFSTLDIEPTADDFAAFA